MIVLLLYRQIRLWTIVVLWLSLLQMVHSQTPTSSREYYAGDSLVSFVINDWHSAGSISCIGNSLLDALDNSTVPTRIVDLSECIIELHRRDHVSTGWQKTKAWVVSKAERCEYPNRSFYYLRKDQSLTLLNNGLGEELSIFKINHLVTMLAEAEGIDKEQEERRRKYAGSAIKKLLFDSLSIEYPNLRFIDDDLLLLEKTEVSGDAISGSSILALHMKSHRNGIVLFERNDTIPYMELTGGGKTGS